MNKFMLCASAIILSHFAMKTVRKLRHPEQVAKEETYRAMRDAREQWLREHQPKRPVAEVDARLMRGDPSAALASIGTVSELEEALRPKRAVDGCDAMAMAPRRFS
ncbi:hypothetical protein [uncultured Fibrobacter sp.]|uniref:hypothetical protein n=1 Tax=uncultured Fibrobacter sp. TaxID=261512 RepID=UPI0025E3A071|nr:hypothetical protein [uncultured Fibrobacter sp.]